MSGRQLRSNILDTTQRQQYLAVVTAIAVAVAVVDMAVTAKVAVVIAVDTVSSSRRGLNNDLRDKTVRDGYSVCVFNIRRLCVRTSCRSVKRRRKTNIYALVLRSIDELNA